MKSSSRRRPVLMCDLDITRLNHPYISFKINIGTVEVDSK